MPIKIITTPFDTLRNCFDDEILSKFILGKKVISIKPELFNQNGRTYWSAFIEYEVDITDSIPLKDDLSPSEEVLFKKLIEWRKERAEQIGYPVFIIASNKQLTDVAKEIPKSLEELKMIHGFGNKKTAKFGKEIIEIVKSFHEKKPIKQKDKNPFQTSKTDKQIQKTKIQQTDNKTTETKTEQDSVTQETIFKGNETKND